MDPKVDRRFRNKRLFHYTTLAGLLGFVETRCLWATHFKSLNDRREFREAERFIRPFASNAIRSHIKKLKSQGRLGSVAESIDEAIAKKAEQISDILFESAFKATLPFVFSFCAHSSSSKEARDGLLSQWRAYGRGGGVAVEFDIEKLQAAIDKDALRHHHAGYFLEPVIYDISSVSTQRRSIDRDALRQAFEMMAEVDLDISDWKTELIDKSFEPYVRFASTIKDSAFAEESEVRLIHLVPARPTLGRPPPKLVNTRLRGSDLVPFVKLLDDGGQELPIVRVIVGPHRQIDNQVDILKMFFSSSGLDIEVLPSSIPYLPDV